MNQMLQKLKVYGWTGMRIEAPGHHHQTREIVAAPNKIGAVKATGCKYPSELFNLCETGNAEEIAKAMEAPGRVFWKPLNPRDGKEFVQASC